MAKRDSPYRRVAAREEVKRIIMLIPERELAEVDRWGPAAGMRSRTQAIRHLLKKGLQIVEAEAGKSGGPAVRASCET